MVRANSASATGERILAISLARFTAESFSATTVRDIAIDAGVTQPTLYYHFGSKDGILSAIVEPLLVSGEELLVELAAVRSTVEVKRRYALERYYDLIVDHLDVFLFVETDRSVRSHPVAGHRLADQASRFLGLVAGSKKRQSRIAAAAALGAVRRPLRLPEIDPVRDREVVLGCALAALAAAA